MSAITERYRFSVNDYHRMGEAGILNEDSRAELIEGDIIKMAPIGSSHSGTINKLDRILNRQAGNLVVSVQNPVRLDRHNEPEPDVALLVEKADSFSSAHPGPADVLLLIEVSDTSADYDRNVKVPLYARSRISEVWLIDLKAKLVELYREPSGEAYQRLLQPAPDEVISPEAAPQIKVNLADILR
jgi:Uma2 family endonuclease